MTRSNAAAGYFRSGLPYNRSGRGLHILVVFQGLLFENKPLPRRMASHFIGLQFLEEDYTIYLVTRKPGLPAGYSMQNMADDYAATIREEFGGPVDVIGTSTGGSIAQHFAADHPDLVRRLVLHSAAHTLGEAGKALQKQVGDLAQQCRWREAYAAMFGFLLPHAGAKRRVGKVAVGIGSYILAECLLCGQRTHPIW